MVSEPISAGSKINSLLHYCCAPGGGDTVQAGPLEAEHRGPLVLTDGPWICHIVVAISGLFNYQCPAMA